MGEYSEWVEATIRFKLQKDTVFEVFNSAGDRLHKRPDKSNNNDGEEILNTSIPIIARSLGDCTEVVIDGCCFKINIRTGQLMHGPCPCP